MIIWPILHHQLSLVSCALLQAKSDVTSKDVGGMTPLHHAAERGDLEVVEVLLASEVRRAGWVVGVQSVVYVSVLHDTA